MKYLISTLLLTFFILSCESPTNSDVNEREPSIFGQWGTLVGSSSSSQYYLGYNFDVDGSVKRLRVELEYNMLDTFDTEYSFEVLDDSSLIYNYDTIWYKLDGDSLSLEQWNGKIINFERNRTVEMSLSPDTSMEKLPVGIINSDSIISGTWKDINDDYTLFRFSEQETYVRYFEYDDSSKTVDSSYVIDYHYSRDPDSGTLYWVVDIGSAHFGGTYNVNSTLDTMSSSHFSERIFVPYDNGDFPLEWILE